MGEIYGTCGHLLITPEEDEPFWLYDGGELSWLVYCKKCKSNFTPVWILDPYQLIEKETEDHV